MIVGGGSGIGLAVAQKAIAAGAEVIIASRSIDKLTAAAQSLGLLAQAECVDATDDVSVREFAERIGPIDHLVMSIKPHLPAGPFLENELSAVQAAFDAKFWGQYRLAKQLAPSILPGGSVVFTSGVAAHRAYAGFSAVSAMNAATEALARALATELSPIRVNTVCPGFVETSPPSGRYERVKSLLPSLPLQRLGSAAEIAEAYLYLMDSAYSTGSVVVVDGGILS